MSYDPTGGAGNSDPGQMPSPPYVPPGSYPPPAGQYIPPPGSVPPPGSMPPPGSVPPPGYVPPPGSTGPGYGSPNTGYPNAGYPAPGYGTPNYGYGSGSGGPQLANYGARLGGWLIDWLIFFVVFGVIIVVVHGVKTTHTISKGVSTPHIHIAVIWELLPALAVIIYGTLMCGSPAGQTIGMRATGVKVVNASDGTSPIGYGKALGRAVVEYVLSVIFFLPWILDMLFPLWDRMKQTLHDKAVGAVVIKT